MKNKTLAILGVGSYVLSVLSSAEDLQGNPKSPIVLIVVSAIVTLIFYCLATVRLWKIQRGVAIFLPASAIAHFILSVAQVATSTPNGSLLVILMNIGKVINLCAFIWAVCLLWAMAKFDKEPEN